MRLIALTLALALHTQVNGQMPVQPRDSRAAPTTGTGVVRGRVTALDTGAPIRRAVVSLSGGPRMRSVYTDDDGRYVFEAVAPGSYSLNVNPGNHRATYRQVSYGAQGNSFGPPERITVVNDRTLDGIDVAVPRGGVISGRVMDPYGEPAARVQVSAMLLRTGAQEVQSMSTSTDDLGQFRLYGLTPGDYIVAANFQSGIGAEVEGARLGFARTFAPGTPNREEASRVRVRAGSEASLDVRLVETHVFNIRGSAMNSRGEPIRNAGVTLMRVDSMMMGGGGSGIDPTGQFTIRNVTPGSYDLIVNYTPPNTRPDPTGRMEGREMAMVRVEVAGADVENVVLTTSPGATFTGEIVFAEPAPEGIRALVSLQSGQLRSFAGPGRVEVKGDTFTVSESFGPALIRASASVPGARPTLPEGATGPVPLSSIQGWSLKEVLLNGKDITDTPTQFTAAHSGRIQVVLTSKAPVLDGTVTDDAGKPLRGAMVAVFSADEEHWTYASSRVRTTGVPRDDGTFMLRGLRPGRYLVTAVEPSGPMGPLGADREFLKLLKSAATEVQLNEGETRSVQLRAVRIE